MTVARLQWMRPPVLASAAFLGTLFLLAICATSYWAASSSLQRQFDTKSRLLAGLERQSGLNPEPLKESTHGVQSEAITAPTGTLAASEVQTTMVDLIEQAGGILHSIQAQLTTDTNEDGLQRLKTQVIFDASNEALQKVLFKLETAKPYSFVESLIVQPTQAAGTAKPAWETLRVTLDASSYWHGDGKPAEYPRAPVVR